MSYANIRALTRAVERAGLGPVAALPDCTIGVVLVGDVAHAEWGCEAASRVRRAGVAEAEITLVDVPDRQVCQDPACQKWLANHGGSPIMGKVRLLLEADEAARSAERFAAYPARSTAAGKHVTLRRHVEEQRRRVRNVLATPQREQVRAAAERVAAHLEQAAALLADAGGAANREKVAARVAAELLPARWSRPVTFERDPVLVAIVPHVNTGKKVQEVIDAYLLHDHGAAVVLHCPRFVVDYLNRFYASGSTWRSAIMTCPAAGLDPAQLRAAAAMFDPSGDGPLGDLTLAVQAAGALTEPA